MLARTAINIKVNIALEPSVIIISLVTLSSTKLTSSDTFMQPEIKFKPIAYTLGEPAGIGADIIIQLAQDEILDDIVCIGDARLLQARARALNLPLLLVDYPEKPTMLACLSVDHRPIANYSVLGQDDSANVDGVLAMLNAAIDGCLNGQFAAMVTGPLNKAAINDAGKVFSGHTEYLAERCKAVMPVMMLATSSLRVALVTTHLPLRNVSDAITKQLVQQICRIVDSDLRSKYGIEKPRILVCGLNPHAGEGGHLGTEEIDIIIPALEELRAQGLDLVGPLPADTLFTPRYLDNADVAIAMYHDQGLPVLKALGFGNAANITLGIPIIRTSVDHGTAYDLAGTGQADTGSLETALNVARQMCKVAINS
ncbi:MAG: 4-hydroxythreonine-4-phosphate dehydrogenase [Dinoroseobacter sp.]|jgi:4-hydroxythreonine-4-phosphate dehydrogenase